ncbi:MAG: FeoA family protein [Clostridia bacterium]|nr:FeoA family protein [Clostridia bacterium]
MIKCSFLEKNSDFTLNLAKLNKKYIISGLNKNYDLKYLKRISQLGFISGEKVSVLRKSFLNKTLLVKIKGYTLLLGVEIAMLIKIKEDL